MTTGSSSRQTRERQKAADWTRGQLVNTLGAGPRALCLEDCRWKSCQERKSLQRTAGSREGRESKTLISRNSSGGTDVLSGRESDLRGDKQEGPELKRDMQKSGVCLGLAGSKAISPGKGERNMGVGKPEAELSLSQVHVSGTSSGSFELGCTGSWEDTKGLLAFPDVCIHPVH